MSLKRLFHGAGWLGIVLAVIFIAHATAMAASPFPTEVARHGCAAHGDADVAPRGEGWPTAQPHCSVACVFLVGGQADVSVGADVRNEPQVFPNVTMEGIAPPGILRPPKGVQVRRKPLAFPGVRS